jgi:hypothetical protein
MQNRVRRELMKLHAIDKEKPTEKFMGRERETTEDKSNEHYLPTFVGSRHGFATGELGLRCRLEEPRFAELAEVVPMHFDLIHPVARAFPAVTSTIGRVVLDFPTVADGSVLIFRGEERKNNLGLGTQWWQRAREGR